MSGTSLSTSKPTSGLFGSRDFREAALARHTDLHRGQGTRRRRVGDRERCISRDDLGADPYRDDVNKISFILRTYQDFLDAKEAFSS